MGVLEELAEVDSSLARRLNVLEKQPTGEDLKLQQDRLLAAQQRLEAEHHALGRRMHAIESESNQAQHHEIQALGRRVSHIEELAADVAALNEKMSTLFGQQAVTHQEENRLLRMDIAHLRGLVSLLTERLEAQELKQHERLATLETWVADEDEWNAFPWWVRLWEILRGRA